MLAGFWNTFIYEPLLNALAFLVSVVPWADVGLAVILLTLLVRIILFPLSKRQIEGQIKMGLLAPEIEKIKKSGKSKEDQARETFDLYKKHKANPFSGCLLIIIQIPIIWALYRVFLNGLDLASDRIYSFINLPNNLNTNFLGLIDISEKSIILAILAAVSVYFYFQLTQKTQNTTATGSEFAKNLSKSMQTQMKYVLPLIIGFFAYTISAAIALYFITYNLFGIVERIHFNKKFLNKNLELETENN